MNAVQASGSTVVLRQKISKRTWRRRREAVDGELGRRGDPAASFGGAGHLPPRLRRRAGGSRANVSTSIASASAKPFPCPLAAGRVGCLRAVAEAGLAAASATLLRESGPLMINHLLQACSGARPVDTEGVCRRGFSGHLSAAVKYLDGLNVIPSYITPGHLSLMSRYAYLQQPGQGMAETPQRAGKIGSSEPTGDRAVPLVVALPIAVSFRYRQHVDAAFSRCSVPGPIRRPP